MAEIVATPVDVVELQDVMARALDLAIEDAMSLTAELNAAVRRVAPCFASGTVNTDQVAEARGIALRAVGRLTSADGWVESVTTGPYGAKFRASAAASGALTDEDVKALKALCGAPSSDLGPLGSFPAAGAYDHLFATLTASSS